MDKFGRWKEYVVRDGQGGGQKHTFYPVAAERLEAAEQRLGRRFPGELREFLLTVGTGFLCNQDAHGFNRLMGPMNMVHFRLGEDLYEDALERETYDNPDFLVFFEVSEGYYLSLDLTKEDEQGICPVCDFDTPVVSSLLGFLQKMDEKTGYFLADV